MKTLKRILASLLILIVLLASAGLIFLNSIKTRAVPDYDQDVDLENLSAPVTVLRDSLGIPHIYAENDLDLNRVVGYVMAQDRLWQMDLLRRVTQGRLSEVLDPSLVDTDQFFRSLQLEAKAEQIMKQCDPKLLAVIEAFSDGINQYMEEYSKKLPFEFTMLGYKPDPWLPLHTFTFVGYMNWTLASGWNEEAALFKLKGMVDSSRFSELIPDMDFQESYVYPGNAGPEAYMAFETHMEKAVKFIGDQGLQFFHSSNNWAVSGKRSKTGMPLMSNDMHLELRSPGIWYQMHQVVEGEINVSGVGFPASPFIVAGHNEDIAWGFTNLYVDDTDFYLETINPRDSNQYLLDGEWKDMVLVEETFRLKGSDEPVTRINRFTHRGPVISARKGISDHVISMKWQGSDFSNEYRSLYLVRSAGNWEEFRDAFSTFYIGQNVVYADRFGNIGLQTVAAVPVRKGNPISIFPGDTSLHDWTGILPFDELPRSFNPPCGYVSSANNRTIGDDYPHYIGTWYAIPDRIERIREMLDEREHHGTEDFKHMLADQHSHRARKMTPLIIEALEGRAEGIYRDALAEMEAWDYEMDMHEAAPMILDLCWIELQRALFADELGKDADILLSAGSLPGLLTDRIRMRGSSAWCDNLNTPAVVESFDDNLRSAFHAAVDTIVSMFGDQCSQWRWGDLHQVAVMHPMGSVDIVQKLFHVNRGPYPIGGSWHTVNPFGYPQGRSFLCNHTASQRHIFNTAHWDGSLTVIPTGISGIPASPHYLDQTELFIKNEFHSDPFSRKAVEHAMKYRAVFN